MSGVIDSGKVLGSEVGLQKYSKRHNSAHLRRSDG